MELNERLRKFREEAGISQTETAKKIGISRQAYNNYERGLRHPDIPSLARIAECFGVTVDTLLGLNDVSASPLPEKKSDAEELGIALKQLFVDAGHISPGEELTEEHKAYVKDLVSASIALIKSRKNSDKS